MHDGHAGQTIPEDTLDELLAVGEDVRANLKRKIEWIQTTVEAPAGEEFLQTWEFVLAMLCWDVSGSALRLGRADELRAARILNRSVIEYAFRLHYYARNHGEAEKHFREVDNFMRKVSSASAKYKGDMSAAQLKRYNAFITSGSHKFGYPRSDEMMKATLLNLGHSGKALDVNALYLESGYSIGSAITHGSQGAIFDVIEKTPPPVSIIHHEKSRYFTPFDSLFRTTMSLIVFLKAMEYHHNADMGCSTHARDLELRFMRNGSPKFSVFTHVPFGP